MLVRYKMLERCQWSISYMMLSQYGLCSLYLRTCDSLHKKKNKKTSASAEVRKYDDKKILSLCVKRSDNNNHVVTRSHRDSVTTSEKNQDLFVKNTRNTGTYLLTSSPYILYHAWIYHAGMSRCTVEYSQYGHYLGNDNRCHKERD